MVLAAACPEGEGLHFLCSPGMSKSLWFADSSFEGRDVVIYSPNLNRYQVRRHFSANVDLFASWEDVLVRLVERHGEEASVTVFPCATVQLNESSTQVRSSNA